MIKLTLCEDEHTTREQLTRLVREWAALHSYEIHISAYESAETFLFAYEDDHGMDILLLDIQMKEMDGLALARKLRADAHRAQIIFITGYGDYMALGYDVDALHYLMKPVEANKLFAVLDKAAARIQQDEKAVIIQTATGQVRIKTTDIRFIESFAHYAHIYLTNGQKWESRAKISDLVNLLGPDFVRCHRSYMVNLRHITQINKTDVLLDDTTGLPLSRRLYPEVNQAFIKYHTKQH